MRDQHSPNETSTTRSASHRLALMYRGAVLAAGILWFAPAAAIAQTTMPGTQPPAGMLATSPLNPQSTRPVGIPLGSTEIATPGTSPLNPAQDMTNCPGSGNPASPGALFDGGGLAGGSSTACSASTIAPSPLPSTSTVGRVGIPLGATELGGAGISPTVPVPSPVPSDGTTSVGSSGNP
ncbi:hypothetical protein JQ607_36585 [Bradyrhizobium liaoningense]|uniref:hypothetical protein n=2 Tax=Bradyrhizobium liaoningense TaxID=43992 RepID=UPI001BA780AB|nr:hypothetical protein [Bradyrhizobium liaoningense]MBR0845739.1 hypothetical protein [Bradyrhizobium liaoningense]